MKNSILAICQRFLGMTPKDFGFTNWSDLQNMMANEVGDAINNLLAFDFKYISRDGFKKEQLVLAENETKARAILVKRVDPKRIDKCYHMGKPLK